MLLLGKMLSQEEEATCQHLIDSMKLCISNSYAVWLLGALFEMSGLVWPVEGSLLHHWDVVSIHHWDVVRTHLLIFTKCESALKSS